MRIAFAAAALLLAAAAPAQDEFAPVRELLLTCTACHGENGASKVPENPILAGQQYYYLYLQLKDFKSGARASEIMAPLVQPLQPEQMKLLAQFYSKQTWPSLGHAAERADVDTARRAIDSGENMNPMHPPDIPPSIQNPQKSPLNSACTLRINVSV